MITLTEAAVTRVRNLQKQRNTDAPLRLGIKQGGCSGLSYVMDFADTPTEEEQQYDCSGVQIVISNSHLVQLQGLELDYTEDLLGGGFRFRNPNASKSCSCGTSFATPKEVGTPVTCS
jgi:iron-sulfur cluster assembly protein